jgi:hypothetical protein
LSRAKTKDKCEGGKPTFILYTTTKGSKLDELSYHLEKRPIYSITLKQVCDLHAIGIYIGYYSSSVEESWMFQPGIRTIIEICTKLWLSVVISIEA